MFEPSLELSLEPLFEPPLDSPVKAATGRALARRAGVEAARRTEGEVDVEFEGLAEKGAADVPTVLLLFVADDADKLLVPAPAADMDGCTGRLAGSEAKSAKMT